MSHTQQQWKVYESKALVSFAFRARHSTWHRVQRNWGCIALERSHFFINCVPKMLGLSNAFAQYWKISHKMSSGASGIVDFFYLSQFLLILILDFLFSIASLLKIPDFHGTQKLVSKAQEMNGNVLVAPLRFQPCL